MLNDKKKLPEKKIKIRTRKMFFSRDQEHPPGSDIELQGRAELARVPARSLVVERVPNFPVRNHRKTTRKHPLLPIAELKFDPERRFLLGFL